MSDCAKIGADVATAPPGVIQNMANHVLTDKGLAAFMEDWAKTGQKILLSRQTFEKEPTACAPDGSRFDQWRVSTLVVQNLTIRRSINERATSGQLFPGRKQTRITKENISFLRLESASSQHKTAKRRNKDLHHISAFAYISHVVNKM